MKRILTTLQGKAVPTLLSVALLLTGVLSIDFIKSLQGDARVINYTGIVRGATQRLVKKELNHLSDDTLIARLDGILSGLSEGSDELDLIRLPSAEFQELLAKMKFEWAEIKAEIVRYRNGGSGDALLQLSEEYFALADGSGCRTLHGRKRAGRQERLALHELGLHLSGGPQRAVGLLSRKKAEAA